MVLLLGMDSNTTSNFTFNATNSISQIIWPKLHKVDIFWPSGAYQSAWLTVFAIESYRKLGVMVLIDYRAGP